MDATRNKALSYRRAEWIYDENGLPDLEHSIRDALNKLATFDARRFFIDGKVVKCLGVDLSPTIKSGLLMHISAETPGDEASIVPSASVDGAGVEVATVSPPPNTEFMDGDSFFYVNGDHVCLCSTSVSDTLVSSYLLELLKTAPVRKNKNQFAFLKVADIDKVKLVQAERIKEVEIKGSLYKATAAYTQRKNRAIGFIGGVAKAVRAFADKPHDVTDDSLRCILVLKTDERSKGGLPLGEKRIKDIAVDLLQNQEEGDDFVIMTKSGQRIGPKELFVRGRNDIKKHGKSVDRTETWKALQVFYNTIKRNKILET